MALRKNNFRRGFLLVPAAGWFGGDGRDVFDRELTTERFRRLHLDLLRVARLLRDFLVRRGFVADVKGFRRIRRKIQDAGFFRNAGIDLVQDRAAEGEAFSVSAEASDRTGKIARVEFWVKDMATWVSPSTLVATVTAPPYTASIKDLKAGHYMVWAIAVNDRGGTTQSVPTHVMINARK